jgi:hypothetical protein
MMALQALHPRQHLCLVVDAPHAYLATSGGAWPALRRSVWTWRSVTGSAVSGPHSRMPKGAAANLAIGGASPVRISSGKLRAFDSARPVTSRSGAVVSMR